MISPNEVLKLGFRNCINIDSLFEALKRFPDVIRSLIRKKEAQSRKAIEDKWTTDKYDDQTREEKF